MASRPVRAFEDSVAVPGGGKVRRWEERNSPGSAGGHAGDRAWRGQGGQKIITSAVRKTLPP